MAQVTLNAALFRKLFGEFADDGAYPDAVLQIRWDEATGYVADDGGLCATMPDAQRQQALNYMTAHLCRLAKMMAAAAATPDGVAMTGVVLGATIDKVQIQLQAPPSRGEWGYWLAQTPYGQQLSALLRRASVGGMYVGGSPERDAFRKPYGVF